MTSDDDLTDEERQLFGDDPTVLVGGPGIIRESDTGQRVRPSFQPLIDKPHGKKLVAEINCSRKRERREAQLIARVRGSRKPWRPVIVSTGDQIARIGEDLLIPCKCGWDHVLDGARLRLRLDRYADGPAPRRPLQIDISEVSRDQHEPLLG